VSLQLLAAAFAGQAGQYVEGGREFARGWIEGRSRYQLATRTGAQLGRSWFDDRTTGRAASAAAVAFYRALAGEDPRD
jgi:hypothetical protein